MLQKSFLCEKATRASLIRNFCAFSRCLRCRARKQCVEKRVNNGSFAPLKLSDDPDYLFCKGTEKGGG
jgi:hypothetical protein